MKRIIPLLALLLLFLAACGESTNTTASTTPTKPSQPTPIATKSTHHKVGEEISVGKNWKITILKTRTSPGSGIVIPSKSTDQFLVISVKMVNISDQTEEALGVGGFRFRDAADGSEMEPAGFTIDDKVKPAPQGTVEAGGLISGDLVYEVPTASKTFSLSFEQYSFQNGPNIWDINV